MKQGFAQIVIISAATLLISAGLIFAFLQKNKTPYKMPPLPSPTPQYQTDETANPNLIGQNWKTYQNQALGFELKYPNYYLVTKEGLQEVGFGFGDWEGNNASTFLIISKKNLTNYKTLKRCSLADENDVRQEGCIDDYQDGEHSEPVLNTQLGNRKAVSFYLLGVDVTFHIVQTTQNPLIELKMNVSGGGLDKTFNQILSTFKFTN